MPQRRLNFIDGTISSHCAILNSDERLQLVKQANEVAAVMADLENDRKKQKEEREREINEKDIARE